MTPLRFHSMSFRAFISRALQGSLAARRRHVRSVVAIAQVDFLANASVDHLSIGSGR
jgi:hypothetical protein